MPQMEAGCKELGGWVHHDRGPCRIRMQSAKVAPAHNAYALDLGAVQTIYCCPCKRQQMRMVHNPTDESQSAWQELHATSSSAHNLFCESLMAGKGSIPAAACKFCSSTCRAAQLATAAVATYNLQPKSWGYLCTCTGRQELLRQRVPPIASWRQ